MPLPRLLALVLAVAGCTPAGSLPDGGGGGGDLANGGGGGDLAMVDPCTVTDCSNVIDAVVVRLLAQHGLPLTPEDNGVLCRRLAIDLSGIAPTANEIDQQCTGHTAAQIADYFMNKPSGVNAPDGSPPYVFINRRWWADAFQYQTDSNSADTWYPFTLELDALVSDLYSGKIRYDEFTRRALAEPAFARRFGVFNANTDLVQIAAQAFRLFMGREALPSEANDFGNLWRAWKLIYQDEPTSEANYPGCHYLVSGTTYANCYHYDLGYASANCAGTLRSSCQSVVLGPAEVVPSQNGSTPWLAFTAADHTSAETPGLLITQQPEFADAAVDRALTKYLGWWKAGWYRPDFDLPAVRDALVAKFVADGYDVRKLEREIVTSVLYTQAAARLPAEQATDPIWAFGPTKPLYGEAWLDTLGQATGKQLGGCDFRFSIQSSYVNPAKLSFPVSAGVSASFYLGAATPLGGCPAASAHSDPTGLVAALSRRTTLAAICPNAFPTQASNDAQLALEFAGIGRDPTTDEKTRAVGYMNGCDATQDTCTPRGIADALCTSLYASALYTFY